MKWDLQYFLKIKALITRKLYWCFTNNLVHIWSLKRIKHIVYDIHWNTYSRCRIHLLRSCPDVRFTALMSQVTFYQVINFFAKRLALQNYHDSSKRTERRFGKSRPLTIYLVAAGMDHFIAGCISNNGVCWHMDVNRTHQYRCEGRRETQSQPRSLGASHADPKIPHFIKKNVRTHSQWLVINTTSTAAQP